MDHADAAPDQSGRTKGNENLSKSDRFYVPVLYVTFAILIVANARNAAHGLWMAYWSLAFLAAVVVSVASRMPWAHVIVQIWAILCIIGSGSLLSSMIYRGLTAGLAGVAATLMTVMLLSAYFLLRAKAVLVPRSRNRETQAH